MIETISMAARVTLPRSGASGAGVRYAALRGAAGPLVMLASSTAMMPVRKIPSYRHHRVNALKARWGLFRRPPACYYTVYLLFFFTATCLKSRQKFGWRIIDMPAKTIEKGGLWHLTARIIALGGVVGAAAFLFSEIGSLHGAWCANIGTLCTQPRAAETRLKGGPGLDTHWNVAWFDLDSSINLQADDQLIAHFRGGNGTKIIARVVPRGCDYHDACDILDDCKTFTIESNKVSMTLTRAHHDVVQISFHAGDKHGRAFHCPINGGPIPELSEIDLARR